MISTRLHYDIIFSNIPASWCRYSSSCIRLHSTQSPKVHTTEKENPEKSTKLTEIDNNDSFVNGKSISQQNTKLSKIDFTHDIFRESKTPTHAYDSLISNNLLRLDSGQSDAIKTLSEFADHLKLSIFPKTLSDRSNSSQNKPLSTSIQSTDPFWKRIFPFFTPDPTELAKNIENKPADEFGASFETSKKFPWSKYKGLYLWGDVGSGKTLIMDIFYHTLPFQAKKRFHFSELNMLLSKYTSEYSLQKENKPQQQHFKFKERSQSPSNSLATRYFAQQIFKEASVLCIDEFQILDIVQAVSMPQFLQEYFDLGGHVILTSNRHPKNLYKNGLQRTSFLPAILQSTSHLLIHKIGSGIDYRLSGSSGSIQTFFENNHDEFYQFFEHLIFPNELEPILNLSVGPTRTFRVEKHSKGIAVIQFKDLCSGDTGEADYKALGSEFHTIFLDNVFPMNMNHRSELRRFIKFIDEIYQFQTKLIIYSTVPLSKLFTASWTSSGSVENSNSNGKKIQPIDDDANSKVDPSLLNSPGEEEIFAFQRTLSRLIEMQSSEYLSSAWKH